MVTVVAPVAALLVGAAILFLGIGLQSIVIPMVGAAQGFGIFTLGLIAAAYSAGFAIGCLVTPGLVRSVGHIRAFAVLAALGGTVALLHGLLIDPIAWGVLRVVSGLSVAGLYAVTESWLQDRSSNQTRGTVFAVYMMVNVLGFAGGQLLLPVLDLASLAPFAWITILLAWGLIPVAMTRSAAPAPIEDTRIDIVKLYHRSPVAVVACLAAGLALGATGGLAAVFADRIGLAGLILAAFSGGVLLGGAISNLPLGRLSDRTDRRWVILGAAVAASAACLPIITVAQSGPDGVPAGWAMVGLAMLLGVFQMPIYGVAIAHANDHTPTGGFVETSSGLLLVYGVGAVIGPLLAAGAMSAVGPAGLFGFILVANAGLAAFTSYRMTQRAGVPTQERDDFAPSLPRTSPVALGLDPRAEPMQGDDGAAPAGQGEDAASEHRGPRTEPAQSTA